jgi:asparagine synthetase B (glutamine-hydrolysing)
MPGIFGAACGPGRHVSGLHLDQIGERLRHQPNLRIERRASPDGRSALGAVDLGWLSGSGRVAQGPDGSLAVVHGEIANLTAGTKAAAAVLEAYRLDPGSLARLQGAFALAIWDAAHGVLVLASDRFGLRNVYYHFRRRPLLRAARRRIARGVGSRAPDRPRRGR